MNLVERHYADHLGPIYLWMVGGAESALAAGAAEMRELAALSEASNPPPLAVDLGAGFGMHAVPLAQLGYQVLAIDSSPLLLAELQRLADGLPIQVTCDDLRRFARHLPSDSTAQRIVCLGDTLTHLPDLDSVRDLAQDIAERLAPGGQFIATFRDYSEPPRGERRFIPVRADERRILTCFLEEQGDHMLVHDLLYEQIDGLWRLKTSSYPKLRLAPAVAQSLFADAGLRASLDQGPRGMIRLRASR